MRSTIVPAQITTVEDKIAGNLNLTQIFLLLMALFFGSIIYITFPPQLHFALYKLPVILFVGSICSVLAIRVKERIIVQWIVILLRYTSRPRYFIANKNDTFTRDIAYDVENQKENAVKVNVNKQIQPKQETLLTIPQIIRLEQFITNPKSNMSFKLARKGELYATAMEIK